MIIWTFRIMAIVGTPFLTYYQVSKDWKGLAAGTAAGFLLVGMEYLLESVNLLTIIIGSVGAVIGIILAQLMNNVVIQMDNDALIAGWTKYYVLIRYSLALLGTIIAIRKIPELDELDKDISTIGRRRGRDMKILDPSAIVDGRIIDICETRFISGTLVVPRFVLNELHHLADSSDNLKRARGRRGLDILARLQESKEFPLKVIDKDVPDIKDVDAKIIKVAKELGARVVTTDFNMNKLAVLEGVTVLNINDLSTALKPVVLPGEAMSLFVMKDGKEKDQGVGYLDDGTMVVVEDGRRWIGKRIEVAVHSILQTSAGRMIFAKYKGDNKSQENHHAHHILEGIKDKG
ncbi:MAG: PIN domain-containing protein [bacterium]